MSKLSDALLAAAENIKTKKFAYNWNQPSQCNCGHLVLATNPNLNADDLQNNYGLSGSWKRFTIPGLGLNSGLCSTSRLPLRELVNKLLDMGMKVEEFGELEFLDNPDVRKRAGITEEEHAAYLAMTDDMDDPDAMDFDDVPKLVVRYMEAWATMIIEIEQAEQLIERVNRLQVPTIKADKKKAKKINRKERRAKANSISA